MAVVVDQVRFGSYHYKESLDLRRQVLRKPLGLDYSADDLAAEANHIHFIALKDGILAGALYLSPVDAKTVKLRQMCVEDTFRRQHIGALMMRHAERWARHKGYAVMALDARVTAQLFYEKSGFKPEGSTFEQVTLPHIRMVKAL